jgi:hypothetical protein
MPDFGSFRGFGEKLVQGQTPTQLGKIGSENIGYVGLLDAYPNAYVAYSLRKLSDVYSGNSIRVRRSSDNAEQDIGFSSNQLDTASLISFVDAGGGAKNGFVTTWYDQSGNAINATQTTAANQPQIVLNSVVISNGGKPCIQFSVVTQSLISTATINRPYSIYSQFRETGTGILRMISSNSSNSLISAVRNANTVYTNGNVRASSYASVNENVIISLIESSTAASKFFYNTLDITSASPVSNDWGILSFGVTPSSFNEGAIGEIKECVVYNLDQVNNNTAIHTNMNTYYAVY